MKRRYEIYHRLLVCRESWVRRTVLTIQAALTNSGLPAILVATKCEHPEEDWEVDAEAMANHKYFQACIATYKVSTETPKEARACLQAILRAAVSYRRGLLERGPICFYAANRLQKKTERPSRDAELSQTWKHRTRRTLGRRVIRTNTTARAPTFLSSKGSPTRPQRATEVSLQRARAQVSSPTRALLQSPVTKRAKASGRTIAY